MAAPRLLLLLTVSLHLQPLHTKYLLVQTLDIFGAIKRSGLAYFYYPAKKWKNMVKNDCSVNITNPCTLGSPYPSHKILIQCKVWSWGKDLMHCSFWRPKAAPYNCFYFQYLLQNLQLAMAMTTGITVWMAVVEDQWETMILDAEERLTWNAQGDASGKKYWLLFN